MKNFLSKSIISKNALVVVQEDTYAAVYDYPKEEQAIVSIFRNRF
jgi:hypothetical protein